MLWWNYKSPVSVVLSLPGNLKAPEDDTEGVMSDLVVRQSTMLAGMLAFLVTQIHKTLIPIL